MPNPPLPSAGFLSPGSPQAKERILIIDDETMLGEMLQDTLQEYNFETSYAENRDQALAQMGDFHPTAALVDYRLGEVNGLDLAQELKKLDPDLPVILMTAYASLDLAVKAIQHDIYDFLTKPVDKTYLLRSIAKAVEKKNLSLENKRLIAHLTESNASLERMNRMKSKFLSIVTHDLRTPLTSIRGYAEMLQMGDSISAEDRGRCFAAIDRSIGRMNGLIANLLDMVSIEAGKLRVEKTPMEYVAVCRELQETFRPVAVEKKVELAWELPPGPRKVNGDSHRLVQVLTNLISNAFKHTPENGRIRVAVSESSGTLRTAVSDNGEGIALEDQARIFEQFFQVESSPTRREGLGLGLTITREIIVAHQGEIGVSSEGLGKGTTFWFTLPLLQE